MASLALGLPLKLGSPRFVATVAAAPLALTVARLLPAEGFGLGLRLGAAAACILILPGALILRAIGWPREPAVAAAGALALSLAVVSFALALTFAADATLSLALAVVAVFALGALWPAATAPAVAAERADRIAAAGVVAAGVLFAAVIWWAAGPVGGDGLFHLARARKLAELDVLPAVWIVNEFRDGGLHPGYAFPLWHGVLALVAKLGGVDVGAVVLHLPAVLVPLAFLVAYGAGAALFRSWAGGVAALAAQAAQLGFARGGTGSFEFLSLPATTGRLLLAPAGLALAFAFVSGGGRALLPALAAAGLALAVVHPPYAVFVAILLAGFLLARLALAPADLAAAGRIGAALAALALPAGLFFVWLLPVVSSTASHRPEPAEKLRAIAHYAGELDVSGDSFRLAPEVIARGGGAVVAALLAVPLAALAGRRLWAAFVLGGSLAVLALVLVPAAFTPFSDLVSISQARRLAGFVPLPFALAGAAVVLGRLRFAGLAAGLAAGVALQLLYPGESAYRLGEGGPAWAVWAAAIGGAAALAIGAVLRRSSPDPSGWAALAAAAFVLPIGVAGMADLRTETRADPYALTPGLVEALRELPPRTTVFSTLEASYRLAAVAPVSIAAAPPAHVARTNLNEPYHRRADVVRFFFRKGVTDAERLEILEERGARWLLVDKARRYPASLLPVLYRVYEDERYALYRVGPE